MKRRFEQTSPVEIAVAGHQMGIIRPQCRSHFFRLTTAGRTRDLLALKLKRITVREVLLPSAATRRKRVTSRNNWTCSCRAWIIHLVGVIAPSERGRRLNSEPRDVSGPASPATPPPPRTARRIHTAPPRGSTRCRPQCRTDCVSDRDWLRYITPGGGIDGVDTSTPADLLGGRAAGAGKERGVRVRRNDVASGDGPVWATN